MKPWTSDVRKFAEQMASRRGAELVVAYALDYEPVVRCLFKHGEVHGYEHDVSIVRLERDPRPPLEDLTTGLEAWLERIKPQPEMAMGL